MSDNIEKKIILTADSSGVKEGVDQAKASLNSINDVQIDKPFKNFKTAIREANNEAQQMLQLYGRNSQQFADASKEVAKLKDEFQEYTQTVQAFNPDNKLQALVSIGKGATGAIQGVTGAMTFLGVESGTAAETVARLQGLMAFSAALNSVDDLKNGFMNLKNVLGLTSQATEGASVATKGFGTAFKAIGIGLLLSAITALVANWDEVKKAVVSFIPALGDLGGSFDKIKEVVFGIGNAIIQYVATPIKVVIDLIKGDMKGAIADVKKGMDVVENYKEGASKKADQNRLDEARKIAKNRVEENEKLIKHLDEQGKNTYELELRNNNLKKTLYDKDSKEYKDVLDERETLINKHNKELNDEAEKQADKEEQLRKQKRDKEAQERKQAAEAARKLNEDLAKQNNISDGKSDRSKELIKVDEEYKEKKKILVKGGQNLNELEEWYRKSKLTINEKFDEEDAARRKKAQDDEEKFYEGVKKAKEKSLSDQAVISETKLINTEVDNKILETDTPDERKAKLNAVFDAEQEVKAAQLTAELEKLDGDEIAKNNLKAKHRQEELDAEEQHKNSLKEIDDAALQSKWALAQGVGDVVGAIGGLFDKGTAMAKGATLAQIAIDTASAISSLVKSSEQNPTNGVTFGAAGAVQFAAGLVKIISNIARAKSLLSSVKTNGSTSTGQGEVPAPSITAAPTINSTLLNPATTQDVRVTNPQDQIVKAYISDRDLTNNEQKKNFLNNLGNI